MLQYGQISKLIEVREVVDCEGEELALFQSDLSHEIGQQRQKLLHAFNMCFRYILLYHIVLNLHQIIALYSREGDSHCPLVETGYIYQFKCQMDEQLQPRM